MKCLLPLFFVFNLINGFSQKSWNIPKYTVTALSIDLNNKFFQDNFDGNLKSINRISQEEFNLESISISYLSNSIPVTRKYIMAGYMRFSYVLPKKILVDTLEQNLRGFNFTFPFFGQNVISQKNISLFFTEGIQVGRLKLVNNENQKMKNMIFAPYIGLVTRLSISHFSLFASAQYDYDISSKTWKKQWFNNGQDIFIPGIRQSGLTFSLGIGYNFE